MSENKNNNVSITLSQDEYEAYMTVVPEPGTSLELKDLGPLLKDHGVVFGIKRDALTLAVERTRMKVPVKKLLVAEGNRPFAGTPPEVELKFEISDKPKEDESGRTDYREISKIVSVEKDQILVVKHRMQEPVNGMTVTGKRTPFPEFDDIDVKFGKNVTVDDQGEYVFYKAAVDGALTYINNTLTVFPTLRVESDVDFNVGNIHFNGDVKIGRDVLPDFLVEADGKILIWGSAIACKLKGNGGVDVRAGIVGKNKGEVVSGADISAVFIENAKLKAQNDIIIKNGIIGSEVVCDGALKMQTPNSRIVGSTIRAAQGISIYNAGSRFDTSTRLISGINPTKEKEYLTIKKHVQSKLQEAKDLEVKHGRNIMEQTHFPMTFSPQVKEDAAKWKLLRDEIQVILKRLKHTEEEMYDYNAVIEIKETLYPRVEITIGKYKLTTVKEYRKAKVKYSPDDDCLVIE